LAPVPAANRAPVISGPEPGWLGEKCRRRLRELSTDSQHSFPGHGQMKPEQQEIARLCKEVANKPEPALRLAGA
jgi:hypothetical protein